ncbi:SEC14-like protein 2 [Nephila pilipes]|uniref:SEC14-like protein 2 n=1 Tax=Nephila pilipes TaxID=299642 RepID=A0A8X6P3F4_NEPPI|nr:SEC14-like protein 2 [Nephila pilipes]
MAPHSITPDDGHSNGAQYVLVMCVLHDVTKCGCNDWKEDLLELVDADVLPKFLGGTKTDPDGNPLCKTFIKHGQKIPETYYLCNTKKKLSAAADVEKIIVTRFSKKEISFEVTEAGSYLEWEFETQDKDIGFSLNFRRNAFEEPDALVPKQRIDTCYKPEKGLFKCNEIGMYTLVFDNSYSWIHPKEIYYRARLRSPGGRRSGNIIFQDILRYLPMMSLYPNVTAEQQEAINELRRRTINDVTPKMLEDEDIFYRFSKARNFNLKEAEHMLRKHIEWRKEYQMDTIVTDYNPPEVRNKSLWF